MENQFDEILYWRPNVVVEWLTLLLYIWEVPGSNLAKPAILTEVSRGLASVRRGESREKNILKLCHHRFRSNTLLLIIHLPHFILSH
jgi:hypothetical protein